MTGPGSPHEAIPEPQGALLQAAFGALAAGGDSQHVPSAKGDRVRPPAHRRQRRADHRAAGLSARCRFLGGDAFEAVPAGADAYILSNFLSSWEDDKAIVPLRNCRQAMPPHGKLLLVEWVIPSGNEPKDRFLFGDTMTFDLIMLGVLGSGSGHVRTRAEFQALLSAAGFRLTALVPTDSSVWVIEADAIAG